jgi:hypothetical protein
MTNRPIVYGALGLIVIIAILAGVTVAQSAGWLTIHRDHLCVTEGAGAHPNYVKGCKTGIAEE